MASLRARLIGATLALALIGLLLLAAVTYLEQRSFLRERVDEQLRAAQGPVFGALRDAGLGAGGPRPGPPGGGPTPSVPSGTYGELRDADGRVLGATTLTFGDEAAPAAPDLPADLPAGEPVDADDHRVLAQPLAGGDELVVAIPLDEVHATLDRLLLVEGIVIAAVLAVLAGAGWIVVRVGLLPLDRIAHTAGAIAGGDLSRRVPTTDPRTEVGRVGLALNAMLDRLEQAFADRAATEERLRRFLADASHELRTPLAAIRGYGELYRLGALGDEAELRRAMGRIEDEAARMGVLVEDLLTLARLDDVAGAPHGPVDLAALVRDAADDARATAPDREIEWAADRDVTVVGQESQLRQVLANLVRNALVHTPAGTPVELSARREGGVVALAVRDHGPGLPPGDPRQLFERFWRAEPGRERGPGGAGLGLAIVAAIVEAHGGTVEAANAPDGGARVTVRLAAAS